MAFQQLHAGKVKLNGLGGIRRHLQERERVKTNPNIDLSRSHLNYCIENLTPDKLQSRVNARIKQLQLKKKPRSDAVGIEDIIVSASADFMLNLDFETREQYFTDALHFFQERYGKENVMYCQCHLDESNPHIHIGIVPITSNGRLSAKTLFSPKTLEQLQTDFHRAVSSHYGLERGEHHAKKYLPLLQFKAQQAKNQIATFTNDLDTASINQQQLEQVKKSAHYSSTGVLFKTEDRENVELPTDDFLTLRNMAEQGFKAVAQINFLNERIAELKHIESQALSDSSYYLHELNKLDKATAVYTDIPKGWRKYIDGSIHEWQKTFTNYCHDLNRAIVRVYISTGDIEKTDKFLRPLLKSVGISNVGRHIDNVIRSAKIQHKSNAQPQHLPPSWSPPKPSSTDYNHVDESGIAPLQLKNIPDIDWDMINWDLLSELDKDEIRHKKILREL